MGKKKKARLPNLDKYLKGKRRHLVTYAEGAGLYQVPFYTFVHLVRKSGANFVVKKIGIVNLDLFEEFLNENPDAIEHMKRLRRFE